MAGKVSLKTNILPPAGEDTQKSLAKRIKYWLIDRRVPLEKGDTFLIPAGILAEFDTGSRHSFEKPKIRIIEPEDEVYPSENTEIEVKFRPTKPEHQHKDVSI